MSISVETVKLPGFSMDYIRFGGGPETLVILPGLSVKSVMGSADAIAEAYSVMTKRYTVFLFDRRRGLPDVYTISDMARDTSEAMKELGISGADVFGASQGGMIAMELAIRYPKLVRALALGSTAARVDEKREGVIGRWISYAKAGDARSLWLDFGESLYPRDVFLVSRDALISAADATTDEELRRFVILASGTRAFDITGSLCKIGCPVLLLSSDDDKVLGSDAGDEIAHQLGGRPDFERFVYSGYGHAAFDTAPDYKERLLSFFERF